MNLSENKLPIIYSGYWDAPLAFVVSYKAETYLFWRGGFDDDLDDYPSKYQVFLVQDVSLEQVKEDWHIMWKTEQKFVGKIHYNEVEFDATHRKEIDSSTFDKLEKLSNRELGNFGS